MDWLSLPLSRVLVLADPGVWGPEDNENGVSVLRSTNFRNDGLLDVTKLSRRSIPAKKLEEKLLRAGDIVLERSGGSPRQPVGRVCFFFGDEQPHSFGNFCQRLRPNPNICDSRYLFWYLYQFHVSGGTLGLQKQTTGIRNLEYKSYLKQRVPLPPPSEQSRIVEILDQADALRTKRAEADAKAARILPALFYKMFGDPATNPNKWPTIRIHDLVKSIARRDPTLEPENTFVYIDIAGVEGKTGAIVKTKELLGAEAPSRARQIVHKNDVIISTVRPYLRATALVPEHLDNQICSTGFCVLRSRDERGFGFLYALSRLQWFTDQLNARARGASYPAVTDGDILNLRVPYPNQPTLHRVFDTQILDVLRMQQSQNHCVDSLEHLFATLLHRAFAGDLTAKWRTVHMKELLVEMEHQAKQLGISANMTMGTT